LGARARPRALMPRGLKVEAIESFSENKNTTNSIRGVERARERERERAEGALKRLTIFAKHEREREKTARAEASKNEAVIARGSA